MKKTMTLVAMMAAMTAPALAHEEGDILVRAGVVHVTPNDSSDKILGSNDELEVDADTQLGLTVGYMLTDNISVELLGATPFSHSISTPLLGLGEIAETKQLPPTLILQYYFGDKESTLRPFVGAGINYTLFFDESFNGKATNAELTDLKLDNSWGFAANAGVDYMLDDNWFVSGSVWYMDISTDATYKYKGEAKSTNVDIDPLGFLLAVGYTF